MNLGGKKNIEHTFTIFSTAPSVYTFIYTHIIRRVIIVSLLLHVRGLPSIISSKRIGSKHLQISISQYVKIRNNSLVRLHVSS